MMIHVKPSATLEQLGQREIAFFFTREYLAGDSISAYLKYRSGGKVPYIANMRLSRADAVQMLASGQPMRLSAKPILPIRFV